MGAQDTWQHKAHDLRELKVMFYGHVSFIKKIIFHNIKCIFFYDNVLIEFLCSTLQGFARHQGHQGHQYYDQGRPDTGSSLSTNSSMTINLPSDVGVKLKLCVLIDDI